jgi:hypothetical protein
MDLDLYEKNVIVIGGGEGVSAARRVAASCESVSLEQAREIDRPIQRGG